MTDKILDSMSRLCGKTSVLLLQAAERFELVGLDDWAKLMRVLAREHGEVALDCHEDTLPTLVDGRRREG